MKKIFLINLLLNSSICDVINQKTNINYNLLKISDESNIFLKVFEIIDSMFPSILFYFILIQEIEIFLNELMNIFDLTLFNRFFYKFF